MIKWVVIFFILAILNQSCKSKTQTDEETLKTYYSFIPVPLQEKDGYNKETKKKYHSYLIGVENFNYQDTLFRKYLMIFIKGLITESFTQNNIIEGYFINVDRDFFYYSNDKGGGDRFPGSDILNVKESVLDFTYDGEFIKLIFYVKNNELENKPIYIPYKMCSK